MKAQDARIEPSLRVGPDVVEAGRALDLEQRAGLAVLEHDELAARDDQAAAIGERHAADAAPALEEHVDIAARRPAVHAATEDIAERNAAVGQHDRRFWELETGGERLHGRETKALAQYSVWPAIARYCISLGWMLLSPVFVTSAASQSACVQVEASVSSSNPPWRSTT